MAWKEGAWVAAFPAHYGFVSAVLILHAPNQLLTAGEDGKVWLRGVMVGYMEGVAKAGGLGDGGACAGPGGSGWLSYRRGK